MYRNDRRMALIQMSNVDEAISALIVTHNHKISETNHLRVTFSKNTIWCIIIVYCVFVIIIIIVVSQSCFFL